MLIRKSSVKIAEGDFQLSQGTLAILKKVRKIGKGQAWNSKNSPPRLRLFPFEF